MLEDVIVRVTNAPTAYDYEATVKLTAPLKGKTRFKDMNYDRPFRAVVLDNTNDGYYADYQIGRYKSGAYLVMPMTQWLAWVADGTIVDADGDAEATP